MHLKQISKRHTSKLLKRTILMLIRRKALKKDLLPSQKPMRLWEMKVRREYMILQV
jgi:hypothetical protein